jgi:hypothetical protein
MAARTDGASASAAPDRVVVRGRTTRKMSSRDPAPSAPELDERRGLIRAAFHLPRHANDLANDRLGFWREVGRSATLADRRTPAKRRANASFTMHTGTPVLMSRRSKGRPARIGRSSVEKYDGLTT